MTGTDAAAVYDAGWSDEALLYAVAVCAYFNNMNRLVEGAGIVGNTAEYSIAAHRLVEHGYLRGTERKKGRAARKSKQPLPGSAGGGKR